MNLLPMHPVLQIGPRVTALPIIHGSGDCSLEVRRVMLEHSFDCVAVPLPPSFQASVEQAIHHLPVPSLVLQRDPEETAPVEWSPEPPEQRYYDILSASYVPIDPCQGVITALRIAIGEHLPRRFIDLETTPFYPYTAVLPDPYALKQAALHRFAAAVLPSIGRVPPGQPQQRIAHMASQLHKLETDYRSILLVCSILDWPWIREAYSQRTPVSGEHQCADDSVIYQIENRNLLFLLGELPFLTGLYERARADLEDDENLSIDGVKELLLNARSAYRLDLKKRARQITPQLLAQCIKYVRNLSLVERRLTPDLYSLVLAAKQVVGDQFALHVAETAREYPYAADLEYERIVMGIDQARLPDGTVVDLQCRLPGPPMQWRSCQLQRRPDREQVQEWQSQWKSFAQCSWPPEDELIENFRAHVCDRAKAIMGADLIQTEKFTTSLKDGIDIRDTLRHWYDGDIYVKVLPPTRGNLDCVVMLFDAPADPRDYPWRTTWFAEHRDESTLAFYATPYRQQLVGPGIGLATYGGAMFLYPALSIRDIWRDARFDFTETLEERLLAAACHYSTCPHIALLSRLPPGAGWRRLAKRFNKRWVHVPLGQFGESTVQQLRMVHVLNGHEVRSYAANFIRRA